MRVKHIKILIFVLIVILGLFGVNRYFEHTYNLDEFQISLEGLNYTSETIYSKFFHKYRHVMINKLTFEGVTSDEISKRIEASDAGVAGYSKVSFGESNTDEIYSKYINADSVIYNAAVDVKLFIKSSTQSLIIIINDLPSGCEAYFCDEVYL